MTHRHNSIRSFTRQFRCTPPTLNYASNILFTYILRPFVFDLHTKCIIRLAFLLVRKRLSYLSFLICCFIVGSCFSVDSPFANSLIHLLFKFWLIGIIRLDVDALHAHVAYCARLFPAFVPSLQMTVPSRIFSPNKRFGGDRGHLAPS